MVGGHLLGVFGQEGLDARAEYARGSRGSFRHGQFRDGYWTRGEVISHIMGTEGEDYFARTTNRFHPNVMLGLELNRSVIGTTRTDIPGRKERTLAAAIDLSVRFLDVYSVFAQYRLAHVDNRNFRPTEDGWDNMLRFEVTRSFR
jgi:hypothetical protein